MLYLASVRILYVYVSYSLYAIRWSKHNETKIYFQFYFPFLFDHCESYLRMTNINFILTFELNAKMMMKIFWFSLFSTHSNKTHEINLFSHIVRCRMPNDGSISYMNAAQSGAAFLFCQIITIQDSSSLFVDFEFNLEFISMNAKRKIFSPFDVVIACWSVYKSYPISTTYMMCCIQLERIDWLIAGRRTIKK